MNKIAALIPLLLLTLAACSENKPAPATDKADGEVLQASVSDAMIPYDTLRSEGPSGGKSDDAKGAATDKAEKKADKKSDGKASVKSDAEKSGA